MSTIFLDQASELRALMQATRVAPRPVQRAPHVIAIASGKGGVGKTNVAVNLSVALARLSARVLLIDVDLGAADVDVILNIDSVWNVSHVASGNRQLHEVVVHVEPGLDLVCGTSGHSADLDIAAKAAFLDDLATNQLQYDIVLLDCGAGVSQDVLPFALAADELFIVTTPEPTAVSGAYALIKSLPLDRPSPSISILVNQAASVQEGRGVAQRLASTARRFLGVRVDDGGQILRDECVPRAVCLRDAFVRRYPRSPASACVAALAKRVVYHRQLDQRYPMTAVAS